MLLLKNSLGVFFFIILHDFRLFVKSIVVCCRTLHLLPPNWVGLKGGGELLALGDEQDFCMFVNSIVFCRPYVQSSAQLWPMVLILDGSSEHDAHIGSETGYSIFLSHLFTSSAAVVKF